MDEEIIKKMNEELIKKTAVKVNVLGGTKLDEVIKFLDEANKNGKNIYVVFNEQNLYSMLDDEDSCYKKVVGMTKAELEREWQEDMQKLKDTAEYDDTFCHDVDEAVNYLFKQAYNGKNVYIEFNTFKGKIRLYSMVDTMNSIYQKVTGYTKGEYDAIHQKVDALKERSKNLVSFEKSADWFGYIIESVEDPLRKGKDVELAIRVMELLDAGDSARAHQIMAQADREYAFALTAILQFAKDGPEFYKEEIAGLGLELTKEERELIESIEAQNNQYKNNGEVKD